MWTSETQADGDANPSGVLVLWTLWEWRCDWTVDGALRLFHHEERYADEVVYDLAAARALANLWLAAVKNLTIPLDNLQPLR